LVWGITSGSNDDTEAQTTVELRAGPGGLAVTGSFR